MITVIEKVLDLTFELRLGTVIVRWMTLEGWLWEYLLEACDDFMDFHDGFGLA